MLRDPLLLSILIILWALLVLFILYPLASLLIRTFTDEGRFSLAGVLGILADPQQRQALWNSLLLATLVGLCGTVLGFLFAYTAVRTNLSKGWVLFLDAAVILPLISPPFTTAIAMIFSFGPRGLITYDLLGISGFSIYGLHSTLFSETITFFPIAYLTLKAILAGIDPTVEDMAFSLGSSRWRVFRTVTLPLTVPGIANAFLLLFAASLADFATPLILAGNSFPILPTQAYLQITGLFDLKGGAVLSFVLLVPAFAVFLLQRYWVSRKYYVTITGKAGAKTEIKSVRPWMRYLLLAVCLLISVSILYFYVLLFYASIVKAFGADFTITWKHYHVVFTEGLQAIRDTLIIAGIGMPLGGIYSVVVGYRRLQEGLHLPADDGDRLDDQLLPARDDRRDRVPAGLQRPAADARGHGDHHHRLLCLPLRSDGDPHDRGDPPADRPVDRGGLLQPRRELRDDLPPDHPAADPPRLLRRAWAWSSSGR